MTTRLKFWPAVLPALVLAVAGVCAEDARKGATHAVAIKGFDFVPKQLTVRAGDTVVWTNQDLVPHTTAAKGGFDSKEIQPKSSWSYKATRKGKFSYICTYHPTMTGELTVD